MIMAVTITIMIITAPLFWVETFAPERCPSYQRSLSMRIAAATLLIVFFLAGQAFGQTIATPLRSLSASSSSSTSSDNPGPCSADARWANTNGSLSYSKQLQLPVSVTLLTHVSKGTNCVKAEVRISATFLTDTQDFICSGTIAQAMTTGSEVQIFNLEVRPFIQNDFLRWRNQPGVRGLQQGKPMNCMNLDGTAEVSDIDRLKAAWVHLDVAVLPSGGGLAVAEGLIQVNP
jgi:hypothetical protein